jgi:hypothetical protein
LYLNIAPLKNSHLKICAIPNRFLHLIKQRNNRLRFFPALSCDLCLYEFCAIKRDRSKDFQMSKSKFSGKAKTAPVATTPAPVTSGTRTIVEIAKSLKIAPTAAREIARAHRDALGGHAHGVRWELNEKQAATLIALMTAPKVAKTVSA